MDLDNDTKLYSNPKRTLQSRSLPKNAFIGIILAIIGVAACLATAFLLCYLNRKSRVLRCCCRRVDPSDISTPADGAEKVRHVRWRDKPSPAPNNDTGSGNEEPPLQDNDMQEEPKVKGRYTLSPVARRPDQSLSIVTSAGMNGSQNGSSPDTPDDPQNFLDLTITPVQGPMTAGSRAYERRQSVRSPLSLTATYSGHSVGNADTGRQPDGSRGRGRRITLSVIVDDPDSSISAGGTTEDLRHSPNSPNYRRDTGNEEYEGILGEVIEHYTNR